VNALGNLVEVRCFAPALVFGGPLAAVHVPFDDLVGQPAYESRIRTVADSDGIALVVGDSGSGKSSMVSSALSIDHGWLAVTVPVSVPLPQGAVAGDIPGLILRGFASALNPLSSSQADRAQQAADRRTSTSTPQRRADSQRRHDRDR